MATNKTPGVYIEEIPKLPLSIASVETAIPAFIGYTQKAHEQQPGDLLYAPKKISSLPEYEQYYGFPYNETGIQVLLNTTIQGNAQATAALKKPSPYMMYYALQLFFANGGGYCYIVSIGQYALKPAISAVRLKKGLNSIAIINEVTLILFPDAIQLPTALAYYSVYKKAMQQCAELKDRFTIMDIWMHKNPAVDNIQVLRNFNFGTVDILKYGAAYYPKIYTQLPFQYDEASVAIKAIGDISLTGTLGALKLTNNTYYQLAKKAVDEMQHLLSSSSAVAGVYAKVDNERGVWKAPANVNIALAGGLAKIITDTEQEELNIDPATGKSINAIRSFSGRGAAIIWGARTLAGNDNEWRYISVSRFIMMVEESVKNATEPFVFEPNDIATWVKIKAMIENYCTQQWKAGALMGTTTKDAFFVHLGLGETMTLLDVQEGRMIVEIGLAVARPAEFIIIRITHQMQ